MKNFLRIFCLFSFLTSFQASAYTYRLKINNQWEFDNLNSIINDAAKGCTTNIIVDFKPSTYFFRENHLSFGDIKNSSISLQLNGNGSRIVPVGGDRHTNSALSEYDYNSSIVSLTTGCLVNPWSETEFAESAVEVLDEATKRCRLKCGGVRNLKEVECESVYLMLTSWCRAFYYKVERIDNGFVYFVADNLSEGRGGQKYNVNNDIAFIKELPRYRLCNLEPLDCGQVHICEAQTFLQDIGGCLKQLSITGFTFLGNKNNGNHDSPRNSLLLFNDVKTEGIIISKCKFIGQNTKILSLQKTDNVTFDGNYVSHNFRWGVYSYNSSNRTRVTNNEFEYNGNSMSYDRCVSCCGSDFYIANNKFTNYGYCAIAVGLNYGSVTENSPKGLVENNTLIYTEDWMNHTWKHGIIDAGAIYLWTRHENTIVRYNTIQNYGGAGLNHGIYCDDGAFNIEVYGNIVTGISNGHCIYSRRVVETKSGFENRTNVNVLIHDNVVDGTIFFVGHEDVDNGCAYGPNFFLVNKEGEKPKTTVTNVSVMGEDVVLKYTGMKRGKVGVATKSYDVLKKSPDLKLIKRRFVRKNR